MPGESGCGFKGGLSIGSPGTLRRLASSIKESMVLVKVGQLLINVSRAGSVLTELFAHAFRAAADSIFSSCGHVSR